MTREDIQAVLKKMARLTLPAKGAGSETFPKATLQFLNFTGESVVATDTHILAVLKKYKSEPHLGRADGLPAGAPCSQSDYPDYKKVLIPKDRTDWNHIWQGETDRYILYQLKVFLEGVDKAARKERAPGVPVLRLHREQDTLDLYTGCHGLVTKTRILQNLTDGKTFDGYYALSCFIKALDLLNSAGDWSCVEMYTSKTSPRSKAGPLITLETPDALVLIAPVTRIPEDNEVRRYSEGQIQRGRDGSGLDFLD